MNIDEIELTDIHLVEDIENGNIIIFMLPSMDMAYQFFELTRFNIQVQYIITDTIIELKIIANQTTFECVYVIKNHSLIRLLQKWLSDKNISYWSVGYGDEEPQLFRPFRSLTL